MLAGLLERRGDIAAHSARTGEAEGHYRQCLAERLRLAAHDSKDERQRAQVIRAYRKLADCSEVTGLAEIFTAAFAYADVLCGDTSDEARYETCELMYSRADWDRRMRSDHSALDYFDRGCALIESEPFPPSEEDRWRNLLARLHMGRGQSAPGIRRCRWRAGGSRTGAPDSRNAGG